MLWSATPCARKGATPTSFLLIQVLDLQGLFDLGVADGARTHDNRNHNPGLYQLSYSHRRHKL